MTSRSSLSAMLAGAVAAASLSSLAFAQNAATQPTAGQTSTAAGAIQRASCVVRIESDNRYGGQPASYNATLVALFGSTSIADPALEAALSIPAAKARSIAQVDVQQAGDSAVTVIALVRTGGPDAVPADAANRLLREITRRAARSFNGPSTQPDDPDFVLADLQKRRGDLDERMTALRREAEAISAAGPEIYPGNRVDPRAMVKQQLEEAKTDLAVQVATAKAIDEQLPDLSDDATAAKPELGALRTRLTVQRTETRIAVAKGQARVDDLQRRLDAITDPTTRPQRQMSAVQTEISDLQQQRAYLDQQINEARNRRSNLPPRPRLVVLDGGE